MKRYKDYLQPETNEGRLDHLLRSGEAVGCSALLAVIGEDGWMSPTEPPDTDRMVQLAWDDMSYGVNSRGFYDSVAEMPASGKMFWWSWPVGGGMHRLPSDHIGAWREMTANSKI